MNHFLKLYEEKTGRDASKNTRAVQKLRREVERAKRVLSSEQQVHVEVESFYWGQAFSAILTRARFEELNKV